MRECLPFAHAISGCDTVSASYGLGKLRAYKKLHESDPWRDIMRIAGDKDVVESIWLRLEKNSTWNCTATSIRRQTRLIIFMILCIQYRDTYLSHASHQYGISIPYATCTFRGENLQESWEKVRRRRSWFPKECRWTADSDNNRQAFCTHLPSSKYEM